MFKMRSGKAVGLAMAMRIAALVAILGASIGASHADYPQARSWFDAQSRSMRLALQDDLFYAGEYFGKVDGVFGPETYGSVRAFQERSGAPATGVLSQSDRNRLRREAERVRRVVAVVMERRRGPSETVRARRPAPPPPVYSAPPRQVSALRPVLVLP